MTARICMACGSDVAEDGERCTACGARHTAADSRPGIGHALGESPPAVGDDESRLFHQSSDVRLEPDRLGEELPSSELTLPAGSWGRASEHPKFDWPARTDTQAREHPSQQQPVTESAGAAGRDPDSLELPIASPPPHAKAMTSPLQNESARVESATSRNEHGESHPLTSLDEVSLLTLVTPATDPRHATGSHVPIRPPVLASEALQRDLTPAEPAPRLLRLWSPLLGLLGVAATWLLTRGSGIGTPLCGAFAALVLLGVPRMPYTARAAAVATVAATGLTVVLWTEMSGDAGPSALVLTLTVTVLAAGLFFRAWHRASVLARVMVLLGILLGASFLWMSEAFTQVTMLDTAWQSWAPRLIALPFGILLMLSLLSFMNARTTAGAAAWGTFVLLWYALHETLKLLQGVWPKEAEQLDFSRVDPQTMLAWGSAPIFSALLALGLAQLIASSLARAATSSRTRHTYFEPTH